MPTCCTFGCFNSSKKGIKMYKIPSSKQDENRRKVWLERIQLKKSSSNKFLCEAHFELDQFEKLIPKKLKQNAIPTIFSHISYKKNRKPPKSRTLEEKPMAPEPQPKVNQTWLDHSYAVTTENENIEEDMLSCSEPLPEVIAEIIKKDVLDSSQQQCVTLDDIIAMKRQIQLMRKKLRRVERYVQALQEQSCNLFNADQLEYLKHSKKGDDQPKVKWSEETIIKATQLLFSCGYAGYNTLIEQGFPLPSERTLRRKVDMAISDCKVAPLVESILSQEIDVCEFNNL